jgi:hypothetical protein
MHALIGLWPSLIVLGLTAVGGAAQLLGLRQKASGWARVLPALLGVYAGIQIGLLVFLAANHVAFPLNLEAMELTVLAHVRRVLAGLPVYVPATSDFTPLAYNPLYYFLAAPFTKIFGPSLFVLRAVSIAGMIGCGIVIFLAVRRQTASAWWGLVAVGVFSAAYRAMDTYLDNAHADSWLLFSALLGCYLISLNRSRLVNILGVLATVAAFWFKQPGAAIALGAVVYLTIRDGRRAWPYWLIAFVLGPLLYFAAPTGLLGPLFHRYTWSIPRQWLSLNLAMAKRLIAYFGRSYPLLVAGSLALWLIELRKRQLRHNVWTFLLPFVLLTAISGAMDSESNNNVFIPLATWLILVGVIAFERLNRDIAWTREWGLMSAALGLTFALLAYNPGSVVVSPQSGQAYADLQVFLPSLNGPVYAPWLGPLQDGFQFQPTVHWVPMTDLVRGPGIDLASNPVIHTLLDPVIHPTGRAYILTNIPLNQDSALSFLGSAYVLDEDLGTRFMQLTALPKRYSLGWPRYLYITTESSHP